jgi:hypothetical protein
LPSAPESPFSGFLCLFWALCSPCCLSSSKDKSTTSCCGICLPWAPAFDRVNLEEAARGDSPSPGFSGVSVFPDARPAPGAIGDICKHRQQRSGLCRAECEGARWDMQRGAVSALPPILTRKSDSGRNPQSQQHVWYCASRRAAREGRVSSLPPFRPSPAPANHKKALNCVWRDFSDLSL